jgi:CMP-N,N'-diacetyllegionaminic acid synthase
MLKNDLKIASIIPARSGSKGLPNKNIRNLGDHPLLAWSIQASQKSRYIEVAYLNTDSNLYANIGEGYGARNLFLRPDYLATDTSTDYDFISHFLSVLSENENLPDILVHLRPTTPFRDPKVIDKAIEIGMQNIGKVSAIRSVHEMPETAYKSFELVQDGFLVTTFSNSADLDFSNSSRQSFPKTFQANGYIDILYPYEITKQKKLHGNRVLSFITQPVIEIDTQEEFKLCEKLLAVDNKEEINLWG